MFRRKDENANDPSNPSVSPATPSGSTHESAASSAPSSASSSTSAAPSSGSSYVPPIPAPRAAAPAALEPVRAPSAPASPTSSYRPTPIAEFNRGAARSMPEAMRSSAPSAPTGFGSAPEKSAAKTNRRVLTVGNDILLKGEIATCDRLVIEGRVEAKLSEVHTVEIAECGSFKGTAEVEDAEISGVFEGDLVVRNRLVIYASGEVRGNISYGEIEIERGGRLTGQIKTGPAAKGKAYDTDKRKEMTAA